MTWIWSFSCDVNMKSILKFVWLFSWYCLALHSNVDLATLIQRMGFQVAIRNGLKHPFN
jgi:hypothetical protein